MRQTLFLVAVLLAGAAPPSPEAQQAKQQADDFKKQGRTADAEQAYRHALQLEPAYPLAHNDLGSLLFENGRIPEAVEEFKQAVKSDPDYAVAWFNLGFASRKTGDFPQAIDAYRHYTQIKPDDTDGWYGLGEACRNAGQKECATQGYQAYLAKEHRPSEAKWIDKAKNYLSALQPAEQPAAAVPAAVSAPAPVPVVTTPPPVPAPQGPAPVVVGPLTSAGGSVASRKLAEGDQLMANKQFREALFAYQDAVNADPTNIEGLFKLGNTYAVMGYFQQAIDRWQRVMEVSQDPGVLQRAQDNIAKAQGKLAPSSSPPAQPPAPTPVAQPPAATSIAAAPPLVTTAPIVQPAAVAPATTPEQARAKYNEGVQRIVERQYAAALPVLDQAIQGNPTDPFAYDARAAAHVGLGQYQDAVQDYQSSLRLNAARAQPLYGIAEAYRGLGMKQDAAVYYQRYADSHAADASPQLQAEARSRAAELEQ